MRFVSIICSVAIFKYLCNKHGHLPDRWYPKDLQKRARIDQYLAWQHGTIRRHGTWIMLEKVGLRETKINSKYYIKATNERAVCNLGMGCAFLHLAYDFSNWESGVLDYFRTISSKLSPWKWTQVLTSDVSLQCLIFSKEPFNQKKYDEHVKGLEVAIKKFENLYLGDHTFIFGENMSIADLLGKKLTSSNKGKLTLLATELLDSMKTSLCFVKRTLGKTLI